MDMTTWGSIQNYLIQHGLDSRYRVERFNMTRGGCLSIQQGDYAGRAIAWTVKDAARFLVSLPTILKSNQLV
jgi:hypothetical protein